MQNFDTDTLIDQSLMTVQNERLVTSPIGEGTDIRYAPINTLTTADPVQIVKVYNDQNGGSLEPGDQVNVTITITARQSATIDFLDSIR